MTREPIHTDKAPSSPLYSQGVRAGSHIFVSGMVALDTSTGQLMGPTIQEQTTQAIANCVAVLEAGGASLDDVVEVGVLLADPDDFAGMNEAYAKSFAGAPPA